MKVYEFTPQHYEQIRSYSQEKGITLSKLAGKFGYSLNSFYTIVKRGRITEKKAVLINKIVGIEFTKHVGNRGRSIELTKHID